MNYCKGDRVIVLKGAPVVCLGPAGSRIQGRNMTVTVDHVLRYGTQPEVVWAGSGGYWTSTTVDWVKPAARKEGA